MFETLKLQTLETKVIYYLRKPEILNETWGNLQTMKITLTNR